MKCYLRTRRCPKRGMAYWMVWISRLASGLMRWLVPISSPANTHFSNSHRSVLDADRIKDALNIGSGWDGDISNVDNPHKAASYFSNMDEHPSIHLLNTRQGKTMIRQGFNKSHHGVKTIFSEHRVIHLKNWNISQMFNTSVSFSSVVMEWVLLQKGGHCSFSCSQRETISWNCLGTERPWDPVVHSYLQKNHRHHCRWKRISTWSPPSDKKSTSWGCWNSFGRFSPEL